MPAPSPRERHAHRPRWRPAPNSRSHLPGRAPTSIERRPQPSGHPLPQDERTSGNPPGADLSSLRLPQLFSPAQAAEILRGFGLTGMTETALRSRAYRRQIPFHLNGRKITFTESDLREIAEGQAQRPEAPAVRPPGPAAPLQEPRRSSRRTNEQPKVTWRARPSGNEPPP